MNLPHCHATRQREYIKYHLRLRGSSFAAVSRELGVSEPTVSQVCGGLRTSERVLSAVAAKLGASVEVLRHAAQNPQGGSADLT